MDAEEFYNKHTFRHDRKYIYRHSLCPEYDRSKFDEGLDGRQVMVISDTNAILDGYYIVREWCEEVDVNMQDWELNLEPPRFNEIVENLKVFNKKLAEAVNPYKEPVDHIETRAEQHNEICKELNDIYRRKNHDYGNSFGDTYKELGIISAVTRITDKVNRLKTLCKTKGQVDESITDTLMDTANYCIMTVMCIKEE